jgi:hypothetical protein
MSSPWLKHVLSYFRERRKTDKNYQYSQAMKDAVPSYKGKSGNTETKSHKKSKKKSKKSHKKRKTKRRKN